MGRRQLTWNRGEARERPQRSELKLLLILKVVQRPPYIFYSGPLTRLTLALTLRQEEGGEEKRKNSILAEELNLEFISS